LRLLLADDDALLREALCEVLEGDGHEVVQAADGQ
jgi:CheY-like chemotaxis protein